MTYETLLFLRSLLSQVTISVSAPDFRSTAQSIITALDELDAELLNNTGVDRASDPPGPPLHDINVP